MAEMCQKYNQGLLLSLSRNVLVSPVGKAQSLRITLVIGTLWERISLAGVSFQPT